MKLEQKINKYKTTICEEPEKICVYGDKLLSCAYKVIGEPYCAYHIGNPKPYVVLNYKEEK
jgi:hypothetical protein